MWRAAQMGLSTECEHLSSQILACRLSSDSRGRLLCQPAVQRAVSCALHGQVCGVREDE